MSSRMLGSKIEGSQSIVPDAKGYYSLKTMFGRSRYNYISAMRTSATDIPLRYLELKPNVQAENLINFSKQVDRNKKTRLKNNMSTPAYNPNYEYIRKPLGLGIPAFVKQSGRVFYGPPQNCLTQYDMENVERGSALLYSPKIAYPDFDKMNGRNTLESSILSHIEFHTSHAN